MSTEVKLTIPDELWVRAQMWADQSGCKADEFLTEALELSMLPLGDLPKPVGEWTDAEVLAAADLQMSSSDDMRLSELLAIQREGVLTDSQGSELAGLMQIYRERLLRKSLALREAVARGLHEGLGN